jgi:hypothetical protein
VRRRRVVAGALALVGLAVAVLAAQLGWSAPAHQPRLFESLLQFVVLVVAVVLVARRVTGKT